MNSNKPIRTAAPWARGFTTLVLIIVAISILQFIVTELVWVLWTKRPPAPATPAQVEPTDEEKRIARIQHATKEFLPDGTLHLVTKIGGLRFRPQDTPDPPTTQIQVYDVNDRRLWDGPIRENPYTYLAWAREARHNMTVRNLRSYAQIIEPWRHLQIPVATEDRWLEMWRYCPWSDHFVGYDLRGQKAGYLGATGSTASQSQAEPFGPFRSFVAWWPANAYSPTLLWQTDRRLYLISFDRQRVEMVFEHPKSDIDLRAIHGWDSFESGDIPSESDRPGTARPLLHCRSEDGRHHLIIKNPDETMAVSTPGEWDKWVGNQLEFTATDQDVFLRRHWVEYPLSTARRNSTWWAVDKTRRVEFYRIDEAGQLHLVNQYSWMLPGQKERVAYTSFFHWRASVRPNVNAFSPLLTDLVKTTCARYYMASTSESPEWVRELAHFIEGTRPGYRLRHWIVTAVFVALTFWHARSRRAAGGALVFWLVLVGLFNLAGFLTYWALNHTPTIKCAACGKRRGLEQVACVRCESPLPIPEHGKLDLILGL